MGFSHIFSRQAVPGSRSPVSRVCQRQRKTSVCQVQRLSVVTCYRVQRRYRKLSVFPAPIPVWRRSSSRSHSTAVLPTLASHTGEPPRPAELSPPSAGVVPSLCWAFPRKHQPQPPPGNLCQSSLCSRQGNVGQARGRAAPEEHHADTSPAVPLPRQSSHPWAPSALGAKGRRNYDLGPYQEPSSGFALVAPFLLSAQRASVFTLNLLSQPSAAPEIKGKMLLFMTQCTGQDLLHRLMAKPASGSAEPRQKGTDLEGTYSDFEDKICWRSYIRNEMTRE